MNPKFVLGRFRHRGLTAATAAVLSLTGGTVALAAAGDLHPGGQTPTGRGPTSIAQADFNGDGHRDIAVANSTDSTVSILLGTDAGKLTQSGSPVPVGSDPQSVAVGDFNGDSHPDLAVANRDSSDVTVLLGDGNGGFAPAPGSPHSVIVPNDFTYGDANAVAVGDFNADNVADLAVATLGPGGRGEAETFLGTGGGTFSGPTLVSEKDRGTGSAADIDVADLNGDGRPDLALVDGYSSDNRIDILFGTGSNTFTTGTSVPVSNPSSLSIADLDGNGTPDLAVANRADDTVSSFLNNGMGSFAAAPGSPVAAGRTPAAVTTGDFNGDRKVDLAVSNDDADQATVLLGAGNGSFTKSASSPLAAGDAPEPIAALDLDGDGKDDLAVGDFNDNAVTSLTSSSPRKLKLKYKAGAFEGKVTSPTDSCAKKQRITVVRQEKKKDAKIGTDKTSKAGTFSIEAPDKPGTYVAETEDLRGCLPATSAPLKLK